MSRVRAIVGAASLALVATVPGASTARDGGTVPDEARAWIEAHADTIDSVVALGGTGAISDAALEDAAATARGSGRWVPRPGDTWHLQLQGTAVTDLDVDVFDLDAVDTPEATIDRLHDAGHRVVCYVNAGGWEEWRDDAGDYPEEVLGAALDGWPGERWVDVRRLDVVGPILERRLDDAAAKGCDAIDPDNVDGYGHDTGFGLTEDDTVAFLEHLAAASHERGLAIGLKNALEVVPRLVGVVDFAVNEQCLAFDECHLYSPFVESRTPVFGVEYEGDFDAICAATADVGAWLLADVALDGRARICP
jgi:hypothetical protein